MTTACVIVHLNQNGFSFTLDDNLPFVNDKPNFGDIYINLNDLKTIGCTFRIFRSQTSIISHKNINNITDRQSGFIRLRLGEALTVTDTESCYYVNIYNLLTDDNEGVGLYFDYTSFISMSRFAQMKESSRVRQSRTDKDRNQKILELINQEKITADQNKSRPRPWFLRWLK